MKQGQKHEEVDFKLKSGTAWSHSYLNQKPWHPLSYPNQRRKWIAEQEFSIKQKRKDEVDKEFQKEQDFFKNSALLSAKDRKKAELKQALSFMYQRPPGYDAESARAAEMADEQKQLQGSLPEEPSEAPGTDIVPVEPSGKEGEEAKKDRAKPARRVRDLYGRTIATEEEFPELKNAPKMDTGLVTRAKPFGIEIRNVRCLRCSAFGHQAGDRECPMRDEVGPNEAARLVREDPLTHMHDYRTMEDLKWELKVKPGQSSPARGGFAQDAPNQQMVVSDIFDEYGGFLPDSVDAPEEGGGLSMVIPPEMLEKVKDSVRRVGKKAKHKKKKHKRKASQSSKKKRRHEDSTSESMSESDDDDDDDEDDSNERSDGSRERKRGRKERSHARRRRSREKRRRRRSKRHDDNGDDDDEDVPSSGSEDRDERDGDDPRKKRRRGKSDGSQEREERGHRKGTSHSRKKKRDGGEMERGRGSMECDGNSDEGEDGSRKERRRGEHGGSQEREGRGHHKGRSLSEKKPEDEERERRGRSERRDGGRDNCAPSSSGDDMEGDPESNGSDGDLRKERGRGHGGRSHAEESKAKGDGESAGRHRQGRYGEERREGRRNGRDGGGMVEKHRRTTEDAERVEKHRRGGDDREGAEKQRTGGDDGERLLKKEQQVQDGERVSKKDWNVDAHADVVRRRESSRDRCVSRRDEGRREERACSEGSEDSRGRRRSHKERLDSYKHRERKGDERPVEKAHGD